MKVIYVAHPYGNIAQNKAKVENILKHLRKKYPEHLFISPIHAIGYYYDEIEYFKGIKQCIKLLSLCDEVWFCPKWEGSQGCTIEHKYATQKNIPIKYICKTTTYEVVCETTD